MIRRFCGYTTLRNLRPFDPFFVLFLLHIGLSFTAIGLLLAYERLIMSVLEVPLGAAADRYGRRRSLMVCFSCAAIAMALFAYAAIQTEPLAWLFVGQTLYGISEALRTGTHKAMMLDWLDKRGRADEATRVVALTRVFSKASGGVAAILGGLLLFANGSYTLLFLVAAVPTLGVVALIASYPRELEGLWSEASDRSPAAKLSKPSWGERLRRLIGAPGVALLVLGSVLFETQVKAALALLQPYLGLAVEDASMTVVGGVGAIVIGVYFLLQGLFAGVASLAGPRLVQRFGEVGTLRLIAITAAIAVGAAAISMEAGIWALGVGALFLVAALQNARRPVFVGALGRVMNKTYRATTLSVESQGRALLYSTVIIAAGATADTYGLTAAFTMFAAGLAFAAALHLVLATTKQPDDPDMAAA